MNKIGFNIDEPESDQEEPQAGHAESDPVEEEEDSGGYGYWLFRAGTDFLIVYGLVMGIKNVINFVRKE